MTISIENDRLKLTGNNQELNTELQLAQLKLQALDIVLKHDIRPSSGPYANLISLAARHTAAINLLLWSLDIHPETEECP